MNFLQKLSNNKKKKKKTFKLEHLVLGHFHLPFSNCWFTGTDHGGDKTHVYLLFEMCS